MNIKLFLSKRVILQALVLLTVLISTQSCELQTEVRLVKNQKLVSPTVFAARELFSFENNNEKNFTNKEIYDEIALLIGGSVEYKTSGLNYLKPQIRKAVKDLHPTSKFVMVTVRNKNKTLAIWSIHAVNTRLKTSEVIGGEIGKRESNSFMFNTVLLSEYTLLKSDISHRNYYINKLSSMKANDLCAVNITELNLRVSPSTKSKVVGILDKDVKVRVLEVTNDSWVKVKLNNAEGYVFKKYITKIEDGNINNDGSSKVKIIH